MQARTVPLTGSPTAQAREDRRRTWLALCGATGIAFLLLLAQVLAQGPLAREFDPAASAWLAAHRNPAATLFMAGMSGWHSTLGIESMLLVGAAILALRLRRRADAVWLVLGVEGAMVLNFILKNLVARPRPGLAERLVDLSSYSFPSGHALSSTIFWACVASLVPASRRVPAMLFGAAMVALVAFSRVYLGAHYPSDVLAGVCEGLLCFGAWQLARDAWNRRQA